MKLPCMQGGTDCPKRRPGCHGQCREYQEYRAQNEARYERQKSASEAYDTIRRRNNRIDKLKWR